MTELIGHESGLRLARAVRVRLEVLRGEGESEDESECVRVAVDAGGVQGRPPLHRQHRDQEREAPQEQFHHLKREADAFVELFVCRSTSRYQ